MQAHGLSGLVVDGTETNAIDVVAIEDGTLQWTVFPVGGTARTIESRDPGVVAFVEALINLRALPDPSLPTSGAAAPA